MFDLSLFLRRFFAMQSGLEGATISMAPGVLPTFPGQRPRHSGWAGHVRRSAGACEFWQAFWQHSNVQAPLETGSFVAVGPTVRAFLPILMRCMLTYSLLQSRA